MKRYTKLTEELAMKMSIIMTITMLQNSIKHPYAEFHFEELIECEYDNLEAIRDAMLRQYNKELAQG